MNTDEILEGNVASVREYIATATRDELNELADAEAEGQDRRGVHNAIEARLRELDAADAPRYPVHTKRWRDGQPLDGPRVLVARYKDQTPAGLSTYWVYAGGPISDPHPLNIAKIKARLHPYGGELAYLTPEQLDAELERETRRDPKLAATGGFSPIPGTPSNDDGEEQRRYEEEAEKLTGNQW